MERTTVRWKDTVTLGTPEAPRKTADLYALDAVLWGTVSEEVRDTPAEIYDYFVRTCISYATINDSKYMFVVYCPCEGSTFACCSPESVCVFL